MSDSANKEVRIRGSREAARAALEEQIDKGEDICNRPINNDSDLERAEQDFAQWFEYTSTLLLTRFTTEEKQWQFLRPLSFGEYKADFWRRLQGKYEQFRSKVWRYLTRLKAITGTLDLLEEDAGVDTTPSPKTFTQDVGGGNVPSEGILKKRYMPLITGGDLARLAIIETIALAITGVACTQSALSTGKQIGVLFGVAIVLLFITMWQITHFRRFTHWIEQFPSRIKHHG